MAAMLHTAHLDMVAGGYMHTKRHSNGRAQTHARRPPRQRPRTTAPQRRTCATHAFASHARPHRIRAPARQVSRLMHPSRRTPEDNAGPPDAGGGADQRPSGLAHDLRDTTGRPLHGPRGAGGCGWHRPPSGGREECSCRVTGEQSGRGLRAMRPAREWAAGNFARLSFLRLEQSPPRQLGSGPFGFSFAPPLL